ncbi:unnamed protein product [Urochloa humidicola]
MDCLPRVGGSATGGRTTRRSIQRAKPSRWVLVGSVPTLLCTAAQLAGSRRGTLPRTGMATVRSPHNHTPPSACLSKGQVRAGHLLPWSGGRSLLSRWLLQNNMRITLH